MTTLYQVLRGDEVVLAFRADFRQAGCQIMVCGSDGSRSNGTPFQVADARHRPVEAARLLNRWLRGEGGECWERGATGLTLRARRG